MKGRARKGTYVTSKIFFHNGYGDYVIARPALRALRNILPGPVDLLVGAGPQKFLYEDLGFDRVITAEISSPNSGAGRSFAFHLADEGSPTDIFVNLSPWAGASLQKLVDAVAPKRGIGVSLEPIRGLENVRNAVELAFAAPAHLQPDLILCEYATPPRFSSEALAKIGRLKLALATRGLTELLAVHADTAVSKMWSPEGFSRVLCSTLEAWPTLAAVIVGSVRGFEVCACHKGQVLELFGAGLEVSMCLVSQADACLSIDSCMMHVADSCGVGGVVLFSPASQPIKWGPFWTSIEVVQFANPNDLMVVDQAVRGLGEALAK